MLQPELQLVEEQFSPVAAYRYNLTVMLGEDRAEYAIEDDYNRLSVLKSYTWESKTPTLQALRRLLATDMLLRQPYRSVKVGFRGGEPVLLPSILFDGQTQEAVEQTFFARQAEGIVLVNRLVRLELRSVFSIDAGIVNLLYHHFPKAELYHASTPLLVAAQRLAAQRSGKTALIHVEAHHFSIAIIDKHQLLLFNRFEYSTAIDFLYFLTLATRQCGFNAEEDSLLLSGGIAPEGLIAQQLYPYYRQLHFVERPVYYRFGSQVNALSPQSYFDLLSLKVCE